VRDWGGIPRTNSVERKGDGRLVDHVRSRQEIGKKDDNGSEGRRYALSTRTSGLLQLLIGVSCWSHRIRFSHSSHPRQVPRSGANAGTMSARILSLSTLFQRRSWHKYSLGHDYPLHHVH